MINRSLCTNSQNMQGMGLTRRERYPWIGMLGLLFLFLLGAVSAETRQENPLKPLDTSSPRATLGSFLDQAHKVEEVYTIYRNKKTEKTYREARRMLDPLRQLFDLREVPIANKLEVGGASFNYLYDILARLPLVPLDSVPGGKGFDPEKGPERWTYPDTEIRIKRIEEGPRKGEYLFSADTVARLPEFHARIIDQSPLRPTPYPNLRNEAIYVTGPLFPASILDRIPVMSLTTILGTPTWKVAIVLLSALAAVAPLVLWNRVARKLSVNAGPIQDLAMRLVRPVLFASILYLIHEYFIVGQVNLSGIFAGVENVVVTAVLYAAWAWAAWLAIFLIIEIIIASPRIPEESYDAHLLRLIARVLAFISAGAILVYGANAIGIPALGLVAGLGVGGFALALASQSTVANLFGGVSLFADRPFRVGDYINLAGRDGVVETIGPRSSRIRGLDGTLTTVPNSDLADMHITNFSMRNKCFFHHVLGLRYETSPGQFEWVLDALRHEIAAHPMVEESPGMPRVRMIGFGASSIDIDVRAYVMTTNYSEFLEIQEQLMLKIMHILEDAGTGFAFPSTTAYLGRDIGLDPYKAKRAEMLAKDRKQPSGDHAEGQEGPEAEEER